MFVEFFYHLRARGLEVGPTEFLTLLEALERGCMGESLDRLLRHRPGAAGPQGRALRPLGPGLRGVLPRPPLRARGPGGTDRRAAVLARGPHRDARAQRPGARAARAHGSRRAAPRVQRAAARARRAPRRRLALDRHRRHQPLRPRRPAPLGGARGRPEPRAQRRAGRLRAPLPRPAQRPDPGHPPDRRRAAQAAPAHAQGARRRARHRGDHRRHGRQRRRPGAGLAPAAQEPRQAAAVDGRGRIDDALLAAVLAPVLGGPPGHPLQDSSRAITSTTAPTSASSRRCPGKRACPPRRSSTSSTRPGGASSSGTRPWPPAS